MMVQDCLERMLPINPRVIVNIGETNLRRKKRTGNAMDVFDQLPQKLRRWLSQANLPWSPVSVKRVWIKSMRNGLSPEEALVALNTLEKKALKKEKTRHKGS